MPETPPAWPVPRWQLLKQQLTNVSPAEFDAVREEGNVIPLDVRTEGEFAAFHLPAASNINYLGPGFLEAMESLDTSRTYLVYCRSGRRSVRACTLMRNAGFNHLLHLDGGLATWQAVRSSTPE